MENHITGPPPKFHGERDILGFAVALANTECAGRGAFGAFGKDNNFAGGRTAS